MSQPRALQPLTFSRSNSANNQTNKQSFTSMTPPAPSNRLIQSSNNQLMTPSGRVRALSPLNNQSNNDSTRLSINQPTSQSPGSRYASPIPSKRSVTPASTTRSINPTMNQPLLPSSYQSSNQSNHFHTFTLIGFVLLLSLLFVLSLASASHILHVHEIEQSIDQSMNPAVNSLHDQSSNPSLIPAARHSIHHSRQTLYRVAKSMDQSNVQSIDQKPSTQYRVPISHSLRAQLEVKDRLLQEDENFKLMKNEHKMDQSMKNKRSSLSNDQLKEEKDLIDRLIIKDAYQAKNRAEEAKKIKLAKRAAEAALNDSDQDKTNKSTDQTIKQSNDQSVEKSEQIAHPVATEEDNTPSAFAIPTKQ